MPTCPVTFTRFRKITDLVGDEIHLQPPNNGETTTPDIHVDAVEELERHTLEKYTFSNALALSGNNIGSLHY